MRCTLPVAAALCLPLVLLAACSGAAQPGEEGSATASGATTEDASTAGVTDTSDDACGNGVIDPGELCDGDDLGGKTCHDVHSSYSGGALGCAANCLSHDASACTLSPGTALVALNEFTSAGAHSGDWAGKGDLIELYNAGDVPADLSGYRLSDDMTLPPEKTYVLPAGTVLGAGEWLVLVELDEVTGDGDFPFGIAQDKEETLVLVDGGGQVVDSATFEGAVAKASYCRVPDGDGGWTSCDQTFGTANVGATGACGDGVIGGAEECDGDNLDGQTCAGLGFVGGTLTCTAECVRDTAGCDSGSALVINEIEATNDGIELYNAGDAPLEISGWILTDDPIGPGYDPNADLEKLVFAAPTSIAAKGFLVVPKGVSPGQHPFGLSGGGDTVTLLQPDLQVVDQVSYAATEADVSFCRLPDGPDGAWTAMCAPTQGAPNQGG